MWSCESCGADVANKRILCPHCSNGAPFADAAQVALAVQRDLIMEAHVRALAVWCRIAGVFGGVGALWLLVAFGLLAVSTRGVAAWGIGLGASGGAMLWIWLGSFLFAASAGSWVLGHHLARFADGARITAGVFAVISLALVVVRTLFGIVAINRIDNMALAYGDQAYRTGPALGWLIVYFIVSSLWSGAVVWALLSRRSAELCRNSYRTIVARTPELQPPTFKSPFFVLPLAATALVFLMMMFVLLPRSF